MFHLIFNMQFFKCDSHHVTTSLSACFNNFHAIKIWHNKLDHNWREIGNCPKLWTKFNSLILLTHHFTFITCTWCISSQVSHIMRHVEVVYGSRQGISDSFTHDNMCGCQLPASQGITVAKQAVEWCQVWLECTVEQQGDLSWPCTTHHHLCQCPPSLSLASPLFSLYTCFICIPTYPHTIKSDKHPSSLNISPMRLVLLSTDDYD